MLSESEQIIEPDQVDQLEPEPEEIVKPRFVLSGREKRALNEALIRFTSCGRCSLFLAAYRLDHDDLVLQTALKNIANDWLTLPTDPSIRALISKSYGCRVDVEAYHFESCCPDCQGLFVYSETDADQPYVLRLKM